VHVTATDDTPRSACRDDPQSADAHRAPLTQVINVHPSRSRSDAGGIGGRLATVLRVGSNPEEPPVSAQSTHVELPHLDCDYNVNIALSFKIGAIAATTVCAIGYVVYLWFAGG
jgi:hypothetical protein